MISPFRWLAAITTRRRSRSGALKFASILLMLLAVGGLIVVLRPAPPPVTITPLPEGWPAPKRSLATRLEAAVPMWCWRLRDSLLGPAQRVLLESTIVSFDDSSDARIADLSLGAARFTDTNGLRAWILGDGDLRALRRRLREVPGKHVVSSPRMETAHGVQGRLWVGNSIVVGGVPVQTGVAMDLLPRIRRNSTDLAAIITVSEPATPWQASAVELSATNTVGVRTNLAVAARMHLPRGSGVFLLGPAHAAAEGRCIGVLISPTVLPSK